jgi:hypothetical protein
MAADQHGAGLYNRPAVTRLGDRVNFLNLAATCAD